MEQTLAQLRNLDTSIEVAKMAALLSQRRVDKQDELIAELRAQLLEAQQERANLAQQVTEFSAQVIHLQQTANSKQESSPNLSIKGKVRYHERFHAIRTQVG